MKTFFPGARRIFFRVTLLPLLPLILMLTGNFIQASGPAPPNEKNLIEPEVNLRLFSKWNDFNFLAEGRGAWQGEKQSFRERSAGGGLYYRVIDNLKVGAFYRYQQGVRHDDDWIVVNKIWHWLDSRDRAEHVVIGDISPRFQLSFLPGENWVFEWKNRFEQNTSFNQQQTVVTRPGLTYFWLNDGRPFLNFFLQAEAWLPVNWGKHAIWETWYYTGFLYHVNDMIQTGLTVALRQTRWSESSVFSTVRTADKYDDEGREQAVSIGLVLICRLDW